MRKLHLFTQLYADTLNNATSLMGLQVYKGTACSRNLFQGQTGAEVMLNVLGPHFVGWECFHFLI